MKKIAAAPPVQQTGNAVHIGNSDICDGSAYQNIDIDYEITIPKGSTVVAASGAGDIHVESIGGYVRARTGKGNIIANGIGSDSFLRTGSDREPSTFRRRMEPWPQKPGRAMSRCAVPM